MPDRQPKRPKRVDLRDLSPETRGAISLLRKRLAEEGWMHSVQVTFDDVKSRDYPPTVDVRALPEPPPDLRVVDS